MGERLHTKDLRFDPDCPDRVHQPHSAYEGASRRPGFLRGSCPVPVQPSYYQHTTATQTANAKKQKKCAEHITSMMKLNKKAESLSAVVASSSNSAATETTATGAAGTSASE